MSTVETSNGMSLDTRLLESYFNQMVGRFYKILPIRETNPHTLEKYLRGMQFDLIGFEDIIVEIQYDSRYMSLINTVSHFIERPNCNIETMRTEVFNSIDICKQLAKKYRKA